MRIVEHRGKWAVRIAGRRFSTGLDATPDNRDAAERKAREIIRALSAPRQDICMDIVSAYFADMPLRAKPKTPRPQALNGAKVVLRWFGRHTPAEVTRDECRAYIASRRKDGVTDGTIRSELTVLKAALNWHDKRGSHVFELPRAGAPRDRWLTREEVARLLVAAETMPHVALFIHIAIATGARRGAILEMIWDTHVDFERGTIWPGFREGGKNRAKPIPMTETLRAALLVAQDMRQGPYLIEWAGKPVKSVRRGLEAAYARAGIAGVDAPAHVLRHTAGAWMAMAGVPLHEIARLLGHSSIRVTERHYAHLAPEAMTRSKAALELKDRL